MVSKRFRKITFLRSEMKCVSIFRSYLLTNSIERKKRHLGRFVSNFLAVFVPIASFTLPVLNIPRIQKSYYVSVPFKS